MASVTNDVDRSVDAEMQRMVERHGWSACQESLDKVLGHPRRGVADASAVMIRRRLAREEKLNAAIMDASVDAIYTVDVNGTIRRVNRAAVESFGYPETEFVGQNIGNIIVGESQEKEHAGYSKRLDGIGQGRVQEVSGRKKDGSEFPAILRIKPIDNDDADDDGNENGDEKGPLFVALLHDNTKAVDARKLEHQSAIMRKQNALSEKMKSAILDAAFDAMFAVDVHGQILSVNRAAVKNFGYDDESELVGRNIKVIVGGEHAGYHDNYLKAYRETGKTSIIGSMREVSARRKDGTEFPVILGIERVEGAGGEGEPLLVAFVQDVTKHRKARELQQESAQLRQQTELLQQQSMIQQQQRVREEKMKLALLDAAFDAMFAVDMHGYIRTVNRAAVKNFGYENDSELIGQNIKIIVGGGHAEHHDDYLKAYRETGQTNIIGSMREVSARRKDGTEFHVVLGIERVEGAGGEGEPLLVAFVRDVTKRRRARELHRKSVILQKESTHWQRRSIQNEHERLKQERMKSAILDAAFDAMFAVDMKGKILMVNRVAVDKFGYEHELELIGENIKCIVGGGHAEFHDDYLRAYCETGETHLIGSMRELPARRKDGFEFPVIVGIEHVKQDTEESFLVAFVRDISEEKKARELEIAVRSAEDLLLNVLPEQIVDRLKADPSHLADHHENASILFADIVGFTAMSGKLTPLELVNVLNDLFTRFDGLVEKYGLNKVKTIGDCYMVTSIPGQKDNTAGCSSICHFAFDMLDALNQFNRQHADHKLDLRVGVNAGDVVAGVVGTSRFLYDLWGDAVNVASRMESTGIPSRIQVTRAVVDLVPSGEFVFESRGEIAVKGKGKMETFFLGKRLRTSSPLKPRRASRRRRSMFAGPSSSENDSRTLTDILQESCMINTGVGAFDSFYDLSLPKT